MLNAIPTAIACLVAIWICYWLTGVFASARTRFCRILCFVIPAVLSAIIIAFPDPVLDPLNSLAAGMQTADPLRGGAVALTAMLTIVLVVPTLLSVLLSAQLRAPSNR